MLCTSLQQTKDFFRFKYKLQSEWNDIGVRFDKTVFQTKIRFDVNSEYLKKYM